jgi:small subunit ribosomal protein S1
MVAQRIDILKKAYQDCQVGQVYTGTIVERRDYGVLVELQSGAVGLLRKDEIDWIKVDPLEIMIIGDEVQVKILNVDEERQRIALSRRALLDNPLVAFLKTAEIGNEYVGTVNKLVAYGIFVEVAWGVRGLIHISKLGLDSEAGQTAFDAGYKPGDLLSVRIIKIDQDALRLGLELA